jgi:hypothetical protein
MLKILPFLTFCFSGLLATAQSPFEERIREADIFLEKKQEVIGKAARTFKVPAAEAVAIGFPELIRYQLVKDLFETTALELLYADLGSREVDFSIGPFQMKPSFVEDLENAIQDCSSVFPDLQWVAFYEETNVKKQREIRLDRMQTFEWQLNYLFSFYRLASKCFEDEVFCRKSDQIAFFASAYNLGFKAERTTIRKWISNEIFPYGKKYNGPQLSYAKLAVRYYQEQTSQKTEVICVND